jgi:Protein of unknown function (DUF3631)
MPSELNDRQQDVCEPLVAIADLAGAEWPERARQALIAVLTEQAGREDSQMVRLLTDVRAVFEKHGTDRLKSSTILRHLISNEESPWASYKGSPLTAAGLARMLKQFDIRPRDLRINGGILKGYERASFEDAWSRYLPPIDSRGAEGQQGQRASACDDVGRSSKGQHEPNVADDRNERSPVNTRIVADVAPYRSPLWAEPGATNCSKGDKLNDAKRCWTHPSNKIEWWLRGGVDWVCGLCHPNPFASLE